MPCYVVIESIAGVSVVGFLSSWLVAGEKSDDIQAFDSGDHSFTVGHQ